jgi:hypothetical protein
MGLGLHGSGRMPIVLLVIVVLVGCWYLGRQWVRRRRAGNRGPK